MVSLRRVRRSTAMLQRRRPRRSDNARNGVLSGGVYGKAREGTTRGAPHRRHFDRERAFGAPASCRSTEPATGNARGRGGRLPRQGPTSTVFCRGSASRPSRQERSSQEGVGQRLQLHGRGLVSRPSSPSPRQGPEQAPVGLPSSGSRSHFRTAGAGSRSTVRRGRRPGRWRDRLAAIAEGRPRWSDNGLGARHGAIQPASRTVNWQSAPTRVRGGPTTGANRGRPGPPLFRRKEGSSSLERYLWRSPRHAHDRHRGGGLKALSRAWGTSLPGPS